MIVILRIFEKRLRKAVRGAHGRDGTPLPSGKYPLATNAIIEHRRPNGAKIFITEHAGRTARSAIPTVRAHERAPQSGTGILPVTTAPPFRWVLYVAYVLCVLPGCVRYSPSPLSPERNATDLQTRTLGSGSWNLARLTEGALRMHSEVEVARAKLATAKAAVVTAGAVPNPTVGYSATNVSRLLGDMPPWANGFTFDVPIETAGKRGHRVAQAQALVNAAALNLSTAEWAARARVRKALSDLYAAKQREELFASQEVDLQDALKLYDARIAAGESSQVDSLQARLLFNQSRLATREAQKLSAEARAALAEAVGISVHALDAASISFAGLDALPPHPNERMLRRAALLRRSDVLAVLAQYAATEAALRLEIAKQYPDLHLGPGYSYDQGQDKWTIGFSLTLPIFDQNRGPILEGQAKRREAAANFDAAQAKALGELERALASYRGALAKLETAGQLLASQEKQQHSSEALFKAGEIDRLSLVTAKVEWQVARLSRLDALIEAQQALEALENAAHILLLHK